MYAHSDSPLRDTRFALLLPFAAARTVVEVQGRQRAPNIELQRALRYLLGAG